MNNTYASHMANPADLPEENQKMVGKAADDGMSEDHKQFCKKISQMIEAKQIDYLKPDSLIHQDQYEALNDEGKAAVDRNVMNIALMLGHVYEFYKSKLTPDACSQLEAMIDQLWDMQKRVEPKTIFKF